MGPSPPQSLGKYQIIREIARSNDIVYEAYDPVMNRRVAVKELAVPPGANEQQREDRLRRFLREAKAAGSLAHPNVVTIFEVGEQAGRHFLAMEYLDGHTLRNEIDGQGFLEVKRAAEITLEVLEALDYAHRNGVVHRDIKPENIQLLSDGRVKLTDFGIARLTFEPNLTMDGQVFGTPSYMSPEQVLGRDIDARSDLFSVGVILYEMLSGAKPFTGDSVVAITYSIINREPERPKQVNHAFWQVLMRALDKSPILRFASAEEMMAAVKDALEASLAGPVLDTTPLPAPTLGATLPPASSPPLPAGWPTASPGPAPAGTVSHPMPVYYPPPPRRPLLSPAAKLFVVRLLGSVLVVGTLFALVVASLYSFFGRTAEDRPVHISEPLSREAEADIAAQARRGQDLFDQAMRQEGEDRERSLRQAAQDLVTAHAKSPNAEARSAYGKLAAQALMALAAEVRPSRPEQARQFLSQAEPLVEPDSEEGQAVARMLAGS